MGIDLAYSMYASLNIYCNIKKMFSFLFSYMYYNKYAPCGQQIDPSFNQNFQIKRRNYRFF